MELNDKRLEVDKLRKESADSRAELEEKVARAKEKNEAIQTDRGFEKYVRTTFPVVKDGEGVIVIYDEDKSPVAPVRSDMTIWERIIVLWNRFFQATP